VSLLGLVAGVVSGLFGVGGAVVIIPGLVLIAKLPQHTAHGTSLAALLLPVGLLGVLEYSKRQQVHWAYAAVVAGGLLIGAYFGARLAGSIPDATLRKLFGGFLLLVSRSCCFPKATLARGVFYLALEHLAVGEQLKEVRIELTLLHLGGEDVERAIG